MESDPHALADRGIYSEAAAQDLGAFLHQYRAPAAGAVGRL
jgi:hypothetical protein